MLLFFCVNSFFSYFESKCSIGLYSFDPQFLVSQNECLEIKGRAVTAPTYIYLCISNKYRCQFDQQLSLQNCWSTCEVINFLALTVLTIEH